MVSRREHFELSEWYYERAKEFKQTADYISKDYPTVKIGYISLAIASLVFSDDHLLNWFLYPHEFTSRTKRHSFFRSHKKVRNNPMLYSYLAMTLVTRNIVVYLKGEENCISALDKTYPSIDRIFRRADNVRNIIKKV
ncbi:MAG: hypothetical protein ACE5J3_02385 [Methanosarcinales archaeon]